MNLSWCLLIVTGATLIETITGDQVPESLLALGPPFNGLFQEFQTDTTSLIQACSDVSALNISSLLTATAKYSITNLNKVLQYSGSIATVFEQYVDSLPNIFGTYTFILTPYSTVWGLNVSNIILEEISMLNTAVNNLFQQSSNPLTINDNAIAILNSLEYLFFTAITMENTLIGFLTGPFAEAFTALTIFLDTIFVIIHFGIFLLVSTFTDVTTTNNVHTILSSAVQGIGFASQIIANSTLQGDAPSSFIFSVNTALSSLVEATFQFLSSDQSVPNVFSNLNLTFQDTGANQAQIQDALFQLTSPIGPFTGSQIFNIIVESFASFIGGNNFFII